ncbi:TPA: hypothetical protein ENS27_13520, partial [bacterium]|nr:hypothetical protein [bacterium]
MNKAFIVLCTLIVTLLGCSRNRPLHNLNDVVIGYNSTIAVDASDDDWNAIGCSYWFLMDKYGETDDQDFCARVKLSWNEKGLFMIADVTDNTLIDKTDKKQDDRIEIFLSPELGTSRIIQYIISNLNNSDSAKLKVDRYDFSTNEPTQNSNELVTAFKKKDRGYILELMIPADKANLKLADSSSLFMNIVFKDADSNIKSYPLFINDNTYNCLFHLQQSKLMKRSENSQIAVSPRIWMKNSDSVFIKLLSNDCINDSVRIIGNGNEIAYSLTEADGYTTISFSRAMVDGSPIFELKTGYSIPRLYCFRDIPVMPVKRISATNFEDDIELFEEYDHMSFPPAGCVVFTGSSSIRLWRDVQKDFPDVICVNRGFGGSTTSDVVYYFSRIVKPYKPSKIVLFTGSNDLNRKMKPEEVVQEYKKFLDSVKIQLPQAEVLVLSVKISVTTKKLQH